MNLPPFCSAHISLLMAATSSGSSTASLLASAAVNRSVRLVSNVSRWRRFLRSRRHCDWRSSIGRVWSEALNFRRVFGNENEIMNYSNYCSLMDDFIVSILDSRLLSNIACSVANQNSAYTPRCLSSFSQIFSYFPPIIKMTLENARLR